MLRMMDYKEVNRRLRLPFGNITAVSPNDRCIWKSLAIAKGAVLTSPFNQASWADNRLLPVEAVPYMYLITFDPNNGQATTTIRVPSGTTPSYPGGTPSNKNGYTFNGWSPTIGPATEDKTYTAQWTENAPTTYTMTWNPNGGTWADADGNNNKITPSVTAGSQIVAPSTNITKDQGWAFDGWYNQTLGRDYQVGDTADGNYTFTAKWTPAVQLLATVSWQTDNDGGSGAASLVHGSPDNNIENGDTTSDWLSATTPIVPINIRFEPLFTLNGQEIGPINDSFTTSLYTTKGVSMPYQLDEASTIIGYYGGIGFKISDLTWDATTTGTGYVTDQLYNNGQPYTYDIDLIFRNVNGGGPTNGNVSVTACNMNTNSDGPQSGYGMAITIHTDSSDPNGNNVYMYWMDEIPVTYVAKYQGNVVTTMTIKMAAYSWAALRDTYGPDASEPNPGTHPRIDGPWKVNA